MFLALLLDCNVVANVSSVYREMASFCTNATANRFIQLSKKCGLVSQNLTCAE